MTVIGVAGGSGNVGRKLVEAIVATGKHEVKVLSRKVDRVLEKELGVPFVVVEDYTNVEVVKTILENNKIHTLISSVSMFVPGGEPPEVELIRAADASKTTKRMISSGWGIRHTEAHSAQLASVPPKIRARVALEETKDLEYTVVHNGYFLDYWCMTAFKSYLMPFTMVVDVPNKTAGLPGDGNTPVSFTHTTDVGKYVASLLDVPNWEPDTYVSGDKVTVNEMLKLAEDITGTKFNITYDSVEKLNAGQATELPSHRAAYEFIPKDFVQAMVGAVGSWFASGAFDLPPAGAVTLNSKFPNIQPLKVKQALEAEFTATV